MVGKREFQFVSLRETKRVARRERHHLAKRAAREPRRPLPRRHRGVGNLVRIGHPALSKVKVESTLRPAVVRIDKALDLVQAEPLVQELPEGVSALFHQLAARGILNQ